MAAVTHNYDPRTVSENQVRESVEFLLDSLILQGKPIYYDRINAGKGAKIGKRHIKLAKPGTADYLACIAVDGIGRFVAIETKRMVGGVQKDTQKDYQAEIEKCGGVYILCPTPTPLKSWLIENGLMEE